jgi:hypothetical protein
MFLMRFRTSRASSSLPETNSETNWAQKHATACERMCAFDLKIDARQWPATAKFESPLPHS